MWHYEPPWRDMRFVIEEVLRAPEHWGRLPAFAEVDAELARQVVDEAGRFATEVLAPLNGSGDLEGCSLRDGDVRTPQGFRAAYKAFVEAGWPALSCSSDDGGQGLPQLLDAALYEMLVAANHAWTMYPGLLHGAVECLRHHASEELRARYLPRLVSGEWLATMCLTEPQAGSDLGLVATRARPLGDGAFGLTGTKIFISGGEHDLTDNIVHLVLARLPDAPAGSRGLSLFLAPKWLPDGTRNALRCDGIEKKMGIKGSATCVMSFDGAVGWLVGDAGRGLPAMFAMMNAARLHVGLQGLGHAEGAWQNAQRYAFERRQGRAARGAGAADAIALHPALRRTLWAQRARVEGARLLAYETAQWLDLAAQSPGAAERAAAERRLALLTPVVKAFLTDNGFAVASDALQVFGGHGYIHEFGIEQCVRDSRIAMIYEGTNEIQALDLLARKGLADGGAALLAWFDALAGELPPAGRWSDAVRELLVRLATVTREVVDAAAHDDEAAPRAAGDYLRLVGLALLAQGWARADAVAAAALAQGSGEAGFYATKRDTARAYFELVLPEAEMRFVQLGGALRGLPALEAVA